MRSFKLCGIGTCPELELAGDGSGALYEDGIRITLSTEMLSSLCRYISNDQHGQEKLCGIGACPSVSRRECDFVITANDAEIVLTPDAARQLLQRMSSTS